MNPAALQEALEGGLFEPQKTPTQQAALVRLETMLALVEGWVDEVVAQATADRMPNAAKLQEIVRRRRAAGGPAEDAFAALVGLELRPRRLRDAATLWGSLRSRKGAEARDAVWAHPDLLPTVDRPRRPARLRRAGRGRGDRRLREFDAALAELLDEGGRRRAGGPDEPERRPGAPHADRVTRVSRLHADALALLEPGARRRAQEGLREEYVAHLARIPTACSVPATPTTSRRAPWSSPPTAARCCSRCTPRRGQWFQLGGHTEPGDLDAGRRGAARGDRGVGHRRGWRSTRCRCSSTPTRCRSAVAGRAPATSTYGSWRWRPAAARRRSATSRRTCAGGRSTRCRRTSRHCESSSSCGRHRAGHL